MKKNILLLFLTAICITNIVMTFCILNTLRALLYAKNINSDVVFLKNKDLGEYDKVKYKAPSKYDMEIAKRQSILKTDFVKTRGQAAQIAESVIYAQKGMAYYDYVINSATLANGCYWVVKASIPQTLASLCVKIDKHNGEVLNYLEHEVHLSAAEKSAMEQTVIFKNPFTDSFVSVNGCDFLFEDKWYARDSL